MIQVKFKNLKKSEILNEAVTSRIAGLVEKFEDLKESRITVTLEMENSPLQAGPDLFNVKLHIGNGRFKGITVTKSNLNVYKAVADLVDHMLEKLNRAGDKERVRQRTAARELAEVVNGEHPEVLPEIDLRLIR
jgi:ribosome-associated translation inhibitor RaiA